MASARLLAWGVDATRAQGSYDFDALFADFYDEPGPLLRVSAEALLADRAEWQGVCGRVRARCEECGKAPAAVLGTWMDTRARAYFYACGCEPARRDLPRFRMAEECIDAAEEDIGKLVILNDRLFECSAILLPRAPPVDQ